MSKNSFKTEIRERYRGRGNAWVKVEKSSQAYTQIIDALKDKDANDYLSDINHAGYAWMRFITPTGTPEAPCVIFEIRYKGSKVEQNDTQITVDDSIAKNFTFLGNTPFKLELEKKHIKKKIKKEVKQSKPKKVKKEKFVSETKQFQEDFEDVIEKEILLAKEAKLTYPTQLDLDQWKSFLASEGLLKNEL